MSNSLKVTICAFFLFVFCGSCGKEPDTKGLNGVYVSGYEYNAQGKRVAKYWKDGVATDLSNGSTDAVANSIYCTDQEVIVAGYQTNATGKKVAVIWKNGVSTDLTDGSSDAEAKSVYAASQFFVMVAGEEAGVARLWQNGALQSFEVQSKGSANCVFVDVANNSTVYVAGYENSSSSDPTAVAKYWKNGKSVRLTDGTEDCYANSIFVSGSDVYVAGTVGFLHANLWKNGISDPISDYAGSRPSEAFSVCGNPETNQIWVAGTYYDEGILGEAHPTVWRAGETGAPVKLEDNLGIKKAKRGNAIYYPEKGEQYVAGSITNANNKSVAAYWHNVFNFTTLTDGSQNAEAKSIFVKI